MTEQPTWYILMGVQWAGLDDSSTVRVTGNGFSPSGHIHACRDGECLDVAARDFWPWVAGLVGVTLVDEVQNRSQVVLDYAKLPADPNTMTIGLSVDAEWRDGRRRSVDVSPVDLWTDLKRLARDQP